MQIRNWPYSKTDITNQKMRWFSIWPGIRPTLMTQKAQNLPTKQETRAQSLGCKDAIEKGMATHSSILAWRILRTKDPGGLQCMESQETDMAGWLTLYALLMFHFSSVTQWCPTLQPYGLQHFRLPCPSPTSRGCSNSCPSSWWCHPTI